MYQINRTMIVIKAKEPYLRFFAIEVGSPGLLEDGWWTQLSFISTRTGTSASRQRAEALGQALSQLLNVLVCGRRQGLEHEPPVRPLHEQSVEEQAVEVRVQIKDPAEALYEGHGPGLAVGDACLPSPQALPCEDSAQEDSEHLREELPVHRQEKPEGLRNNNFPFSVADASTLPAPASLNVRNGTPHSACTGGEAPRHPRNWEVIPAPTLSSQGKVSTHCRYGVSGSTRSTRWAAVSAALRA